MDFKVYTEELILSTSHSTERTYFHEYHLIHTEKKTEDIFQQIAIVLT